jgi:hypothetical protein
MGLLFNTEQTTKMLALMNRHFGHKDHGGAIEAWKDRIDDFDPRPNNRKELIRIAKEYEIHPDPSEDKLGRTKARWHKWLKHLEKKDLSVAVTDPAAPTGGWPATHVPHYSPLPNPPPSVGKELCRQLFNVLIDPNCLEIAFVTLPSTNVSIDRGQIVQIPNVLNMPDAYTYIVTIRTKRVDEI